MIGTIVTPMARGQITIPKEYRDKLGIVPGVPLNVNLEEDKIIVMPLAKLISDNSKFVIKPEYSREEYLRVINKISDYITKNGPIWTKADEAARKTMRKKEKAWEW